MTTLCFIVPAYNEESGLGATLDSIRQAASATGVPYELIVVDDASTDQTSAVAASRGATIVRVAHRQIAAARNAGANRRTNDSWPVRVPEIACRIKIAYKVLTADEWTALNAGTFHGAPIDIADGLN